MDYETNRGSMKPCGTNAAYQQHYLRGGKPCDPCREASNAYKREQRRKKTPYANTTPRIIADHLETFGPMRIQELTWLVQRRHVVKGETVRRAVHRMLDSERLSATKDIEGRLIVEVPDA